MTNYALNAKAEALGEAGYRSGLRAPAQDEACMTMIGENTPTGAVGHPNTLLILEAWTRGWSRAHNEATNAELEAQGFWSDSNAWEG